jgi:hypothetical protein
MVMDPQTRSSTRLTIACGLLAAAMGLFYILYSAIVGPSARHNGEEPGWLGFVFGMIFLLGGSAAIIKTVVGSTAPGGGLPATAPRWLSFTYHAMVVAIVVGMGLLASWIAFGPGQRQFSGSGAIFGEIGGRIAFGIGALIIWIVLVAIVVGGARRFIERR